MTWGPNIATIDADEWNGIIQVHHWMDVYKQIMRGTPMPYHDHSPVAAETNELRFTGVIFVRQQERIWKDACRHRAQVYNLHAQTDGVWRPER